MIDESGRVTGFIDFEGATVAPLWECALLPRWLQDPDDPESTYEGGWRKVGGRCGHCFWRRLKMSGNCCMSRGNLSDCSVIGCHCKSAYGLRMIWKRG
ncbi:hypothetical protein BDZ97DRAFT_1120542 [Flammula alnicola]|nr:hypothetical protein BDZ97DRAFT_1120542 [Flammula alnicola]